jgi:hypothetical protein
MLSMAVIGSTVYFPADDGTGFALWRCTGTAVEKLGGVNPRTLTPVHWMENNEPRDAILFAAYSESEGVELWKYDHWLAPSPKRSHLEGAPLAFIRLTHQLSFATRFRKRNTYGLRSTICTAAKSLCLWIAGKAQGFMRQSSMPGNCPEAPTRIV